MPTTFIAGFALDLPQRWQAGDPIDATIAEILDYILHRRVQARLRWMLTRGEILEAELQSKALELCAQDLKPHLTLDDDADDPILLEALVIARELITSRMAAEGLPPPKGLDDHARVLVNSMPQLQEQARKRIEARYKAAMELIGP